MDYYFEIELDENEYELFEEARDEGPNDAIHKFGQMMLGKLKKADEAEVEL